MQCIVTTQGVCRQLNVTPEKVAAWKAAGCPVHLHGNRRRQDQYNLFAVCDWLKETRRARDLDNISASLRRAMQHLRPEKNPAV